MKDRDLRIKKAKNILELARQHKEQCKSAHCGVILYFLLEDFERYMMRPATQEEFKVFI